MEALESAIYHIVPNAQEEIKHLDEVGIEPSPLASKAEYVSFSI